MKKHKIGQTGLEVTEICFGTSSLGDMPETYGYVCDEARAIETVAAILDGHDVNFIDSSRVYGDGRSEERIGAAIRARGGLPPDFVLATKLDRDTRTGRFDAAQARQSLEESLTALGLDKVQILHLHDPEYCRDLDEVTRSGGALDELFKIKEDGLTDAVGLAMGRIDLMFPLLKSYPFDVLINHNRLTLLNQTAADMYDFAHESGIAVFNAAPYAGGVFAKGSNAMPLITYQTADDGALEPVRKIESLCAKYGVSPAALALQFSMRDPRVTSTIVGISKPSRIDQTIHYATEEVPQILWDEIKALPVSTVDPEAERDLKPYAEWSP